jgi:hypothetical protein
MSLVLVGSTSGSVTLQEPAVAGTTVLTLPAVSGNVLTDTSPKAGNVIQVVGTTFNNGGTAQSTTSSTFVATSLTASITPTSSSSKIYIVTSSVLFPASGQAVFGTIYRNSTNLGNSTGGLSQFNNGNFHYSTTMTFLDSPATTSSTTYTVYFRTTGGTAYFGGDGVTCTMTLLEIAG